MTLGASTTSLYCLNAFVEEWKATEVEGISVEKRIDRCADKISKGLGYGLTASLVYSTFFLPVK